MQRCAAAAVPPPQQQPDRAGPSTPCPCCAGQACCRGAFSHSHQQTEWSQGSLTAHVPADSRSHSTASSSSTTSTCTFAASPSVPVTPAPASISHLPDELLGSIVRLVLEDDAAHQRRPVVQFVGRRWLCAYRCAAYSRVCVDVGAALRSLQHRRGLGEAAAAAVLLQGLAARLPYAREVSLRRLPLPPPLQPGSPSGATCAEGACPPFPCLLRWRLGELLVAHLSTSSQLHSLSIDYLPLHLPLLLAQRAQRRWAGQRNVAPLHSLRLYSIPAAQLLANLSLLLQQPLHALEVSDAACLHPADSAALAAALPGFYCLSNLILGGSAAGSCSAAPCPLVQRQQHQQQQQQHASGCMRGQCAAMCSLIAGAPAYRPAASAGASASTSAALPAPAPASAAGCLPDLQLVAAAAALPCLQQLELSLTFGREGSPGQHNYLERLGCVLHQQHRLKEAAAAAAAHAGAAAAAAGGAAATGGATAASSLSGGGGGSHASVIASASASASASANARASASRVSVTVHENVQGDLSAVPVASCSLNLDWDSDSNPIEVWQCSTLNELRIAAQLPLQAGHFRPARLSALQVLQVVGCCHIPAYFAAALCSMPQLVRFELSDCQLDAVASIPWQAVLPRLPSLRQLSVQRCAGAVLLPGLWGGLAAGPQLRRLRITGQSAGGGLPPAPQAANPPPGFGAGGAGGSQLSPWQQLHGPQQQYHQQQYHQQQQQYHQWQYAQQLPCQPWGAASGPAAVPSEAAAAAAAAAPTIPDCVALLGQLQALDLSHNGLQALPDAVAWCQQLTELKLGGNSLRAVPAGVAVLGSLRKLDLSSNQLEEVAEGPYLSQLEELSLGSNLVLHPSGLPQSLLLRRTLRLLRLPLWKRLTDGAQAQCHSVLLQFMPWLALEYS